MSRGEWSTAQSPTPSQRRNGMKPVTLQILLATFGSLRWGELMGLRKSEIDLNEATVSIELGR